MAVGNESLDDCDLFTSSFDLNVLLLSANFLPSFIWAILEITSLRFIFVCVPEPVCQITRGNSLSCFPSIIC